jgi:hypothetical protein
MGKAYILKGGSYLRYDVDADAADAGYPKEMTGGWSGLGGTGFESDVDSVVDLGNGKAYLFKGDQYLRVDQGTNAVDGEVSSIAENWGGLGDIGFAEGIGAAINWSDGKLFLFRGDSYARYDIAADHVDDGYPLLIADQWPGLADLGFGSDLDAAVLWPNGKAFFFKGDQYVRFDVASDQADAGYPQPIADGWAGLAAAGFAEGIDAVWIKIAAGGGGAPHGGGGGGAPGQLVPGDHVWYFNGQISTDRDIPRSTWFPGSVNETDYKGHGDEIFNFVIHANGEIRRGRPHMRGREGTFAWLNNNPGNLTGQEGGPAFGQYQGKFNWHHFLIFPSHDAGFAAIPSFLQREGYFGLGIQDAFRKYAPAKDGNTPDVYAASVAQAAGVSVETHVGDLNSDQMLLMQKKIEEIEGTVPGVVLSADSPELPEEIRSRL